MESYTSYLENGRLIVKEFRDSPRNIVLTGPKAERLASLYFHKLDLVFALQSVNRISLNTENPDFHNELYWRSAITHLIKCFGSSDSRFQLSEAKIYSAAENALDAFNFYKDLRNNHYIHDGNHMNREIPVAVLSRVGVDYNIEKIVVPHIYVNIINAENILNLRNLILRSIEWVDLNFSNVADSITNDLEEKSRDELLLEKEANIENMTLEEVMKTRRVRKGS